MVGEQGNQTSGSRASGSSSVPQSYWWKRIHNLNARSRLQEVSGGFSCAEKFSSLVSCHRGYGYVAFYAVFSLFILTFLYAIWKIVNAHSRSARRPGSSNTTSATKLSPTAHSPTDYANAHTWMRTEIMIDHSPQSVKKLLPFQNKEPQQKPMSLIHFPSESVTNNFDPSTKGNGMFRNPTRAWPSRFRQTKRFYNYYPGSLNNIEPPLNYPAVPYPTFFNPPLPTVPYPKAFNPYFRPPFSGGVDNDQNRPFETSSFPYNGRSVRILNEKSAIWSDPQASNVSFIAPYYLPSKRNSMPQGSYENSYYGENPIQDKVGGAQTSPSPLITYLEKGPNTVEESSHQKKHHSKQRKNFRKKITRQKKKKHNRNSRKHSEYEEIEDIEEESSKKTSNEVLSTRRLKIKGNREAEKHIKSDRRRKMSKDRHGGITVRNAHHRPLYRTSQRKRTSSKTLKVHHPHHRAKKPAEHKRGLDRSRKYLKRTKIPHQQVTTQASPLKHSHHHPRKQNRVIHRRQGGLGVHRVSHERHHKILDFKLYRSYRKQHSVNDEIRGKWQISKHRVRTCKLIDTFSTRGTVKLTRVVGHNSQYLYTLLACRPVRLRIRLRHHQQRFSLKYAQLCSKKWYVTKGVINIQKPFSNDKEIPRYNVRICDPSYAHAMKLLPAKGKETEVWSISKEFFRRLEEEDARKFYFNSSHLKRGHRHEKKKLRQHEKKKKSRSSKSRSSNENRRKHNAKKMKRKTFHHRGQKIRHHLKLKHVKQSKLKKKQGANDSKVKNVLGNKRNEKSSSKTRGNIAEPDELFYGKLLKVLKLARTYERRKVKTAENHDVFDSLEAVLMQRKNIAKIYINSKNNRTTKINVGENRVNKHEVRKVGAPKLAKKSQKGAKVNIQKLLAKVLPAVLSKITNGYHDGEEFPVTTKPTKSTTTPKTSTVKAIPSNQITTASKTSSSEKSMLDIIKNVLPLLRKRTGKEETNLLPSFKSRLREKMPSSPAKQTSQKPKKTMDKTSLISILSRLGFGNLASNSLNSTIFTKTMTETKKPVVKSTQKASASLLTTTLMPKIPFQLPATRPTQTPSASVTIQVPPPLRQPDILRPSVRKPLQKLFSPPGNLQISPPGLPSVSLSAPSSGHLPGPQQALSPISVSMSGLQAPVSPHLINSDPYSRNVLCFGDSLTSGFYDHGRNYHPYSQRLSQLLNSDGRLTFNVKTSGKVREMAHGSMARRLPEVLGNSSRFDWVIILGGTNDVAHVKNFGDDDAFMTQLINVWQPRIVRDIEILHEIAHKYGARTVLLTIPETAYEAWPSYKTLWVMRNRLNEDLRNYARRSQGNVVLCDLAAKLPRHSLPPQTQALLWNDHLHLTPYGYDKMAEIVYQCLKPYLS